MTNGKTLYLVRHAKAGWMNSGQLDFDRVLAERGIQEAIEMGKTLQQRGIVPDVVLCSPARRVLQTIEQLAPFIGVPIDQVFFNKSIYEAQTSTLLKLIQNLDDTHHSAMLIGHNPAMSWLISELTKPINAMPTCSIATICIDSNQWKEAGLSNAELLNFSYPR